VGRHRAAVVLAAAGLVAGCGNSRTPAPLVPPAASPVGKRTVVLEAAGVAFRRPANWPLGQGTAPLIGTVTSGRAAVVLWRYPRVEPLPQTGADLQRARRALTAAARARDRTLRVLSSRVVTVGGARGVQLVADERLGSSRRQVRSTHLYAQGAELAIDAYAPPGEFARVDRTVFAPLLRSLRIGPPGTNPVS
jgi:hypothetical protein